MMYNIEARIPAVELMKWPYYFPLSSPIGRSYSVIRDILHGTGKIERYEDYETMEIVLAGARSDEFPFQAWPVTKEVE
jgi:hypothetical protein